MKTYSVWDSVKIFYNVLRLFGHTSFSIEGKIEKGKIRATVFDNVSMIFWCLFISFIIYTNFKNDYSLIKTNSFIIDKANHMATLFLISNVLFSNLTNMSRRKQIWNIFKVFYEFDQQVIVHLMTRKLLLNDFCPLFAL